MSELPGPLAYLLFSWGVITAVLLVLLIYRSTLVTKEDDQLFLNKAETSIMASEQQVILGKLQRLVRPIVLLALLSGILLVVSAGVWVWIGLTGS